MLFESFKCGYRPGALYASIYFNFNPHLYQGGTLITNYETLFTNTPIHRYAYSL